MKTLPCIDLRGAMVLIVVACPPGCYGGFEGALPEEEDASVAPPRSSRHETPDDLSRRSILTGIGSGAALGLLGHMPFLGQLPSAHAAGEAPPKFLLMTFPNSWGRREFWDLGLSSGDPLPELLRPAELVAGHPEDRYLLQPLEPYRDKLTMLAGARGWYGGNVGVHGSYKLFLTGTGINQYGPGNWEFHALGPSVDQYIAQRLGVDPISYGIGGATYVAANEPAPTMSPQKIFERFFEGAMLPGSPESPPLASNTSFLDPVYEDLKREFGAIPRADQLILDRYLTELHELEVRINAGGPVISDQCEMPDVPPEIDKPTQKGLERGLAGAELYAQARELIVKAFQCNLTQVAVLAPPSEDQIAFYSLPEETRSIEGIADVRIANNNGQIPAEYSHCTERNRNDTYIYLDCPEPAPGEHGLDHSTKQAAWVPVRIDLERYYVGQIAAVLEDLSQAQDMDGRSVLDNTIVMITRDLAVGANHAHWPHLHLFAGSTGVLNQGRYVDVGDAWLNHALITACHLMGLTDVETFGKPENGAGPFGELLA